MTSIAFERAARVPAAGDNVAIAVRRLEAGTHIDDGAHRYTLPYTVLEGHRFVREPIAAGEPLLSWGLPFGKALSNLERGEYVCNASILDVLAERSIDITLPSQANFEDHMQRYELDEVSFTPGKQVTATSSSHGFLGIRRGGDRGVGTRNFIIIQATTARANAFANALAKHYADVATRCSQIDGVVAIEHTEGTGSARPNNLDFVLRCLCGFMVHPNVAAALSVDDGLGAYNNDDIVRFMAENDYPINDVDHAFMTLAGSFDDELARAQSIVDNWLPSAQAVTREAVPLSELKVALQCGGSDAFSGISGNALAGWVAKSIIAEGGSANLAETDELIGAEPYVLRNVRDVATARRFLAKIETFKRRAANHGASAEGNPSGGNKLRGLYNIALKSIGAARKLDPNVRLDGVLDYGAPMREPGYFFMDSPGNDLESIAGQVASGCNLIFFITGNGAITNFPFVPTLKFVTTTGRFEMLQNEMDVNAGRYNDGLSMQALGDETLDLALAVASGQRSKGEQAGHAQVQIWRDWKQTSTQQVDLIRLAPTPDGRALAITAAAPSSLRFDALVTANGFACDQIALVMPTSLCSGQVARVITEQLNANHKAMHGISRFVCLVHTEGCGSANSEQLFMRTLCGHLSHGFVRSAVLLEHGCEKTHNDAVRQFIRKAGLASDQFGWASVQLDGGMAAVTEKVQAYLRHALEQAGEAQIETVDASKLRIALMSSGTLPHAIASTFSLLARSLVSAGATVVVAENDGLAGSESFTAPLLANGALWRASLDYGQVAESSGLHVMRSPSDSPLEQVTGLGGTGVEIMLAHIGDAPLPTHPMIPMLQVSTVPCVCAKFADDLDWTCAQPGDPNRMLDELNTQISDIASRRKPPRLNERAASGFQLTRGLLGISM